MSKIPQFTRYAVGSALLATALGLGVFGIAAGSRDLGTDNGEQVQREYDEDHSSDDNSSDDRDDRGFKTSSFGGAPVDAVYHEECGSCHVAYPPGLLPSAGWRAIMDGLDDHYGDNAELPVDAKSYLTEFLDKNASDRGDRMKNARLLRDVANAAPLRITGLPYFKGEHDEIPVRMSEDNPEVQSFSRCDACHKDAAKGRFDEDTVAIPGFGRWDD
ncbi:diheme cytochrome c [Pseudomonadota bacterium]